MALSLPSTQGTLPSSAPPAAESTELCPRCSKPLTDAKGLGWCQACGFCKSLEEDRAKIPLQNPATAPAKANAVGAMGMVVGNLPIWLWILLLGMALFAAATLLPAHYFGKNPLHRALWCTGQIVGGLVLLFTAQFLALLRLAPEDEKLGIKDVFLPFRLWGLIFQRLPALRFPLWIGGWGVAIIISALVFVGGLSHWMTYLPKSGNDKGGPGATRPAR
jgi:hypothetical protein